MKKIILLLLIAVNHITFAQDELNEGIITTKTTMSSENPQVNSQLTMLGDLITTVYFKNNKSRSEMNNPMAGQTITIIDTDVETMLLLMDNPMLGKKYSKNDLKITEDDLKEIVITENGESKTVLNYVCKGYDVVVNKSGLETKMVMFVTDKIMAPTQNNVMLGDKLKGYPLYMMMNVKQMGAEMNLKIEATAIEAGQVDDAKFALDIPEGYEEIKKPTPATID